MKKTLSAACDARKRSVKEPYRETGMVLFV